LNLKSLKYSVVFLLLFWILPLVYLPVPFISQVEIIKIKQEVDCMKEAVWYESRSEGTQGMKAVAQVILNRSRESSKGICDVIHAPFQFSYRNHLKKGQAMPQRTHRKPYNSLEALSSNNASAVAFKAITSDPSAFLKGSGVSKDALWYKTKKVNPKWAKVLRIDATIKNHQFYRK